MLGCVVPMGVFPGMLPWYPSCSSWCPLDCSSETVRVIFHEHPSYPPEHKTSRWSPRTPGTCHFPASHASFTLLKQLLCEVVPYVPQVPWDLSDMPRGPPVFLRECRIHRTPWIGRWVPWHSAGEAGNWMAGRTPSGWHQCGYRPGRAPPPGGPGCGGDTVSPHG